MKKRKPPQVIAWIVEGLDLCNVNEGIYEVICQPMKIENADGAPATVLIRKRR